MKPLPLLLIITITCQLTTLAFSSDSTQSSVLSPQSSPSLLAAPAPDPAPEINHLLTTVQNSKAKFIRNGAEHTAKDAAAHMKKKYNHFKKQIKTTEDFIEKCAAKSELSDKPYQIKDPDGTLHDSKTWMLARLAEFRKQTQ